MNKKEVMEIIKSVSIYYQNKFKMDDPIATIDAWYNILRDYEFEDINANLKEYVKHNHFAPSVSELIRLPQAKDRALPDYAETKVLMSSWEAEKANRATKEQADKALAEMRKTLGIQPNQYYRGN